MNMAEATAAVESMQKQMTEAFQNITMRLQKLETTETEEAQTHEEDEVMEDTEDEQEENRTWKSVLPADKVT